MDRGGKRPGLIAGRESAELRALFRGGSACVSVQQAWPASGRVHGISGGLDQKTCTDQAAGPLCQRVRRLVAGELIEVVWSLFPMLTVEMTRSVNLEKIDDLILR